MSSVADGAGAASRDVLQAALRRGRDVVDLAVAETRLAALSVLAMVMLAIVAAAALVVAWGLVVACVLYLFAQSAIDWPLPAIAFAVAHTALAYYLWQAAVKLSRNLTLPELRATLRAAPPAAPPEGDTRVVTGGP
jgi:hypothetical protein